MIKQLTVKIIMDNNSVTGSDLNTNGFSALVEAIYDNESVSSILFDTGYDAEEFKYNVEKLSIDLSKTSRIFLSHGHFDHTGGLKSALDYTRSDSTIYSHPDTFLPKIFKRNTVDEKQVGFPAFNSLDDLRTSNKFELNNESVEICPGVHTSGEVPRESEHEKLKGMLLSVEKYKNDNYSFDDIDDDMSLIIEVGLDQIVLITGCCHSGLVNTIRFLEKKFSSKKIIGIIGGLQLHVAEKDQLKDTLASLKDLPLVHFYPLHSSGETGINFFKETLSNKTRVGGVGSVIQFTA